MPWEHGTYFSENDERMAREFLVSQGLTDAQVEGVKSWHRSKVGGQVSLWSGLSLVVGGVVGFFVARGLEVPYALF